VVLLDAITFYVVIMSEPAFIAYEPYDPGVAPEVVSSRFCHIMARRRTIRHFSDRPVSSETIQWLVRTASTAPSGANKQPWRFVCVKDPKLKHQIRLGAEKEEREFYHRRANQQWLDDLRTLGTDEHKDFLEVAPWLIVVFRLTQDDDGSQTYYTQESVGIAVGMLLCAAHHAGLVTLTHTPSPMKFLCNILGRPAHERPFLLIVVGYPADGCLVPAAAVKRKPLDQVMIIR